MTVAQTLAALQRFDPSSYYIHPQVTLMTTKLIVCFPDFKFEDHGSIILLTAVTGDAQHWCDDHLPEDCARHGSAYAIEPRYFGTINSDILDAGFLVQRGYR
jgi:hypothetical protein